MIPIILLATLLVVVTFIFHYKTLLWLAAHTPYPTMSEQSRVLFIVMALFIAHIVEITVYSGAYFASTELLDLGDLKGASKNNVMEYFYFSTVIYTSLGLGDIYPDGHIQLLIGIETLNGLLLIAWSASFTFLAMGRLWPWIECCNTDDKLTKKK